MDLVGASQLLSRRGLLTIGIAAAAALQAKPLAPPTLFLLGDSWGAGLYADPRHALGQVAAGVLGWQAQVDAVSGTGYVTPTSAGGSYPQRLRAAGVVRGPGVAVIQGGSNDGGSSSAPLLEAVLDAIAVLAEVRPGMQPLLLGPGPDPEPVDAGQLAVDAVIGAAAATARVPYVSMLAQDWIPAATADSVLDPGNHHPTVAGQRYLGARLAAAIRTVYPDLV